jgi:hypothetical protein
MKREQNTLIFIKRMYSIINHGLYNNYLILIYKILLIAHHLYFYGWVLSIWMMGGSCLKSGDLKDAKILFGLKLT